MVCAQCKQREATVHLTKICGDKTDSTDLCVECASDISDFKNSVPLEQFVNQLSSPDYLEAVLREALGDDHKYPIEAYKFIREAVEDCLSLSTKKTKSQTTPNVSGKQLLEAIRQLALKKFGKQAKSTLASWKICRTEDVGEIVFEMVDAGLLAKRPEDSIEDFQNVFSFDEVFPED